MPLARHLNLWAFYRAVRGWTSWTTSALKFGSSQMIVDIIPIGREERDDTPHRFVLPPDKSIFHRVLFLGSLTQSAFRIPIPSPKAISHDIVATVLALESLGVPVEVFSDRVELQGVGRRGYRIPSHLINCANSGTTARLLMGLLAGQSFSSALTGDDSLSARPMKRLADLLRLLNAQIVTSPDGTLPLMINGQQLKGVDVTLPVASAQMKSAILLAGLHADGITTVREPWQSRDHTERMLEAFGFGLEYLDGVISIDPAQAPMLDDEVTYEVPGDLSSAAFLIVASILLGRTTTIEGVLLNPTRTRFLDLLTLMGVDLSISNITEQFGEERGTIDVHPSSVLEPFHITADEVPLLIDELPILSILAAFADGESTIHGAGELRHKESDRLRTVANQLRAFGVTVEEFEDGLSIHGIPERTLHAAPIVHEGDHRLAMAFAIAAMRADGVASVEHAEVVGVSYPDFFHHLSELTGEEHVKAR